MLSLVHLIYMAGDKCVRQNACLLIKFAIYLLNFSVFESEGNE